MLTDFSSSNGTVNNSLTTGKLTTQNLYAQRISTAQLNFTTASGNHITRQDIRFLWDFEDSIYLGIIGGIDAGNGTGNTGVGAQTLISANRCTAIGATSQAINDGATALGYVAVADGEDSTAIGNESRATGGASVAVGKSALSQGESSVSVGSNSQNGGIASISVGQLANASNTESIAVGKQAVSAGAGSIVLGKGGNANAANSIAIGSDAIAANARSVAIGSSANATIDDSLFFRTYLAPVLYATATLPNFLAVAYDVSTGQCGPATVQPQIAYPYHGQVNTPATVTAVIGELVTVLLNAGSGTNVITLPTVVAAQKGQSVTVALCGSSLPGPNDKVSVEAPAGYTVNHMASLVLDTPGQSATFNYDGLINWQITSGYLGPASSKLYASVSVDILNGSTVVTTAMMQAVKTGRSVILEFDNISFTAPTPQVSYLSFQIPWAECHINSAYGTNFMVISSLAGVKTSSGLQFYVGIGSTSTIFIGGQDNAFFVPGGNVVAYAGSITYNTLY